MPELELYEHRGIELEGYIQATGVNDHSGFVLMETIDGERFWVNEDCRVYPYY